MEHLAVPKYITSGRHMLNGIEYRFMVMQRFGTDVEKHFRAAGSKFCDDTVCYLAVQLVRSTRAVTAKSVPHQKVQYPPWPTSSGSSPSP